MGVRHRKASGRKRDHSTAAQDHVLVRAARHGRCLRHRAGAAFAALRKVDAGWSLAPRARFPRAPDHRASCDVLVATVGTTAWFFPTAASQQLYSTPEGRVYGYDATSDFMISLLLGELVMWDIPMTFFPSLFSGASLGHHVGMAVTAAIATRPFMLYYVPFFAGVVEISSIPLQVVDVFHPKHFIEWASHPLLARLNSACRVAFAVLFLITRSLYFPIVVFGQLLPDLWHVASRYKTETVWAAAAALLATGFTALQLYWSFLILKQLVKKPRPPPPPSKPPPENLLLTRGW